VPPSRRHARTAQQPVRRPRVAGLRRPGADAPKEPTPPVWQEPEDTDDSTEATQVMAPVEAEDATEATQVIEPVETEEAPSEAEIAEPDLGTDADTDTEAADPEAAEDTGESAGSTAESVRTRPAGKRRARGIVKPTDLKSAEDEAAAPAPRMVRTAEEQARARRNLFINRAIVFGVVALLFAGLALWFRGEVNSLSGDDSNTALTDTAKTSEAIGQLRVAVEKTLSYNYTDLASTENAVREYVAGRAQCEYEQLFGQVKKLAPEQKLVLTTKVRDIGVSRLTGDSAQLIVFIDQTTTRTGQNQTTASGAQFGIRAERQDGRWKITQFDMLGQPLPNGQQPPQC
jgi:Mce-associated membrane protein